MLYSLTQNNTMHRISLPARQPEQGDTPPQNSPDTFATSNDRIRERAQAIYQNRIRTEAWGTADTDWQQAQRELRSLVQDADALHEPSLEPQAHGRLLAGT